MTFTPKERKIIDEELAMVEEQQRLNGNKTYTFDELVTFIYKDFGLTLEDYYDQFYNKYNR